VAKLSELAFMIRSRRAGLNNFEIDVLFREPDVYRQVVASRLITVDSVAELYNAPVTDVVSVEHFDPGNAIHVVMRRPNGRASGDPGDTDISGGLQYFPLSELEVELDVGRPGCQAHP
jgi:Domain of unknown function (DUF4387)